MKGVTILDGGLATELERRGHDLDDPLWSARVLLEDPAAIAAVHRDYAEAGAQIITTATYQATFEGLARRGLGDAQAREVFRTAARIARIDGVRVAGSIGPYGAYLADGSEYRGDYGLSVDALVDFHGPRIELLAPLVDVLACETIPCLAEAQALGRLLPGHEAWVSFSCRIATEVCHGEPLGECIDAVGRVGAVGVNCVPPSLTEALLHTARAATSLPLVAYPNCGEHYHGTWSGRGLPPAEFAALARTWAAAGAEIIGGCCRTTPAHIRALTMG
jgi:homocysteine S-methyltransferase